MPGKNKKGSNATKHLYNEAYDKNTELQYMYRDASKLEDVKVLIDEAEFLEGAKALVEASMDKKNLIKIKERECPLNKNIKIKDAVLDVRGPGEDSAYSVSPFLIKNIRRGNTLIEVNDGSETTTEYIGRKGLIKFFDMATEFIEPGLRTDTS
jgi:hypothetical protein